MLALSRSSKSSAAAAANHQHQLQIQQQRLQQQQAFSYVDASQRRYQQQQQPPEGFKRRFAGDLGANLSSSSAASSTQVSAANKSGQRRQPLVLRAAAPPMVPLMIDDDDEGDHCVAANERDDGNDDSVNVVATNGSTSSRRLHQQQLQRRRLIDGHQQHHHSHQRRQVVQSTPMLAAGDNPAADLDIEDADDDDDDIDDDRHSFGHRSFGCSAESTYLRQLDGASHKQLHRQLHHRNDNDNHNHNHNHRQHQHHLEAGDCADSELEASLSSEVYLSAASASAASRRPIYLANQRHTVQDLNRVLPPSLVDVNANYKPQYHQHQQVFYQLTSSQQPEPQQLVANYYHEPKYQAQEFPGQYLEQQQQQQQQPVNRSHQQHAIEASGNNMQAAVRQNIASPAPTSHSSMRRQQQSSGGSSTSAHHRVAGSAAQQTFNKKKQNPSHHHLATSEHLKHHRSGSRDRSGSVAVAALGCCGKLVKSLLFMVNLIFWSSGLALGAWGILTLVEDHKYNLSQLFVFEPSSRMSLFQLLSWSFITLGCATILVGFCGCSALFKNSRWILGLYIFLILAIFALDLATGLLAMIFQERLVANVRLRLANKLRTDYGVQASFTAAIDYIQTRYECCGLEGHFDYDQSLWRLQRLGGFEATVARTCCHLRNTFDDQAHVNPRPVNESMCQSTDVRFHQSYRYRKGCLDELERLIRQKIWWFTLGCGAVGSTILVSLVFATCFCRSIPSRGSRKGSPSAASASAAGANNNNFASNYRLKSDASPMKLNAANARHYR